jgi:hypothetical protein
MAVSGIIQMVSLTLFALRISVQGYAEQATFLLFPAPILGLLKT